MYIMYFTENNFDSLSIQLDRFGYNLKCYRNMTSITTRVAFLRTPYFCFLLTIKTEENDCITLDLLRTEVKNLQTLNFIQIRYP